MLKVIILMLISLPSFASTAVWDIKVTYPDREVKTYSPSSEASPLTLGKFGWECSLTKEETTDYTKSKLSSRTIICRKGGLGGFTLLIGCIRGNSASFNFSLYDTDTPEGHRAISASCKIL